MSTFRTGQNQSNTRKLNVVLSTIIFILILNLSIQIWLLYTALNNALENNKEILVPAFVGSAILFLINFMCIYYLPSGNTRSSKKRK